MVLIKLTTELLFQYDADNDWDAHEADGTEVTGAAEGAQDADIAKLEVIGIKEPVTIEFCLVLIKVTTELLSQYDAERDCDAQLADGTDVTGLLPGAHEALNDWDAQDADGTEVTGLLDGDHDADIAQLEVIGINDPVTNESCLVLIKATIELLSQ